MKSIFKKPLLITQEEMALLLGITQSQWSMVVLGLRYLPIKAKTKLEEILNVATNSFEHRSVLAQEKEQKNDIPKIIVSLLQDTTLKQLQQQRKLQKMEEKFQMALNTLHFVNGYADKNKHQSVLKVIENKANKVLEANNLSLQEMCKIKLEVLKHEERLLRERIKKL